METKIKEPELRFQGFTEEWNETTLGEIADIIGGGTPDTKKPEYWDGEIDWYSPTEIGQATYATGSRRKITSLGLAKSSAKILPADKTILFTSRAGIGDMAILKKDGATNQGFQSMVVNENNDVYFVYSIGDKIKKFALQNASGSTFLEVSGKTLRKMTLLVPLKIEQSKIGLFFKQLDDTISHHQQELTTLKQAKQGFLQKMFPKEGETVPEVRFPGFIGEWEERKFSELVKRVSTQSNSDKLPKVEFEDIISGEGRLNKDVSKKLDGRKGIVFRPGFILFGKLRPYLKNWLLPDFTGVALGDFWVFEPQNSPASFIYYLIQTDKYQTVANLSTGTKMPRSDWKTVSNTDFLVPSNEEQVKIGEFFTQLDGTIELHEKELEALKETKKAFLQKMFV